jgi:uncharacterized protein YbjT (DUF2867 family)
MRDLALHDSIGLHLPQLGSQDLVANPGKQVAQCRETPGAESQVPYCHDLPLSADHINGRLHRTSEMIFHRSSAAYKIVRTSGPPLTVISFCRIGSPENESESARGGRNRNFHGERPTGEDEMILVTGASGTVGKAVLAEVSRSGARHRAMYRSKADAVKAPTRTETVIADFADRASLAAALRGVESVYLVCSPVRELVELEGNAIDACVAAGVRRIVLNSALGAADYAKSFPSWHRKVEDKLNTTKIARCILRPNSFSQNVLTYNAPSIRQHGAFYGSTGNARISYVDVRDIATVAAKALEGGEHDGKIYELNGPAALTNAEVAEKISGHAGLPVRHVDISEDAQRNAMLDQGMPEWQVTALLELQRYYTGGQGGTVDTVLEKLLGRPPIKMDQFLAEVASEFRPQAANA